MKNKQEMQNRITKNSNKEKTKDAKTFKNLIAQSDGASIEGKQAKYMNKYASCVKTSGFFILQQPNRNLAMRSNVQLLTTLSFFFF